MLLFSIVVPAYNYARYLPRALDAALAQSGGDYEIIVIDDGSSDETADVVKPYLKETRVPVRYVYQTNKGPSAARNRGIVEARGEYLLFLDADDRLLPNALSRFGNFLTEHEDADMVIAGYVSVDPSGSRKTRPGPALTASNADNFKNYIDNRLTAVNGAMVVRRRVLQRIRFPEDLRNNEELAVIAQVLATGRCFAIPDIVLEVHAHEGRQRGNVETLRAAGARIVDCVFDPAILPPELMSLRERFLGRILLSRFRSFYRAGEYHEAVDYYRRALRIAPGRALRPRNWLRFLHARLRRARGRETMREAR